MHMNRSLFNLILLAALCSSTIHVCAQTEVHVEKAGTLSTLLPATDKELTVTGSINGTDVKYLRQLINAGSVTALNLADVRIVKGGVAYYEADGQSYKTENDIIGSCMFRECAKLRTIELPNTITAIRSTAFANSGLLKVDIPNRVSQIGGDAFAYCSSLATVVLGSRVSKMDQGVFYSSPVKTAYVKPLSPPAVPAYLFSSSPKVLVYSDVLADYKASDWKQYTLAGKLENYYPKEEDPTARLNSLLANYFEDAACTRLKADCQAKSDDELMADMTADAMPEVMVNMALKLKNDTWAAYEQDFRIHSYKAFSDAAYWNNQMKSTGGSYMGNPTGIYADALEPLYVFVDADVPEDATLYIAGCVGNDLITNAKTGTRLTKGLNIIEAVKDALYYIVYTADTKAMSKTLDEWPAMKIHIEGGAVNGYYDVARHSDTDYRALLKAAKHERFTIKSEHALFNFKTSSYKTVWPRTIDKSISWFDSLAVWQRDLMGYTVAVATGQRAGAPFYLNGGEAIFPIYYNNPNFAIEGTANDAGYANSTPYRTCYNSVDCIRNSFDVSRYEMDDWCSAHECGHNNQAAINLEGGTEVSNNLFSNYIRYVDGLVTSAGSPLSTVMEEAAYRTPFYIRNVNSQLRMYWQLYLYYHLAQKNTSFYPNLFKELREDPLTLWTSTNNRNSGLKFVRKVCEVAKEDLTEFFAAYGFFEPVRNLAIDDYGAHTLTVRQADIDRTLAEIAQYPKNRTILFVEDRVDYVLTTDFLTTAGQKRRDSERVGQCGDLGQFTDYLNGSATLDGYTYWQADSLYAMEGEGGIGFLMQDAEGKMVYAANAKNFCIPTCVGSDFSIWSVDADGTLHATTKAGEGIQEVYLDKPAILAERLDNQVIKAIISGSINGTDFKYMRKLISEENLASLDLTDAAVKSGGVTYYESYRTANNAMGSHAFYGLKKLMAIRLPQTLTRIETNAFSNTGLREITIPDRVTTVGEDAFAYCDMLSRVIIGEKVRTLAKGVFYNSQVKDVYVKPLTPPTVSSYLFSSKPKIHVYASALAAYKASGWAEFGTLVGDLDEYEDIVNAVEPVQQRVQTVPVPAPVYDLFGRKVTHLKPSTIYIRGGRKFVTAP